MHITILAYFLTLLLLFPQETQGWRDIAPLHSTRANVEKLLGPPNRVENFQAFYELKNEYVRIEYSGGLCGEERKGGWNVPRDTVLDIRIGLKRGQLLSDFHLDVKDYKRAQDPHLVSVFYCPRLASAKLCTFGARLSVATHLSPC